MKMTNRSERVLIKKMWGADFRRGADGTWHAWIPFHDCDGNWLVDHHFSIRRVGSQFVGTFNFLGHDYIGEARPTLTRAVLQCILKWEVKTGKVWIR